MKKIAVAFLGVGLLGVGNSAHAVSVSLVGTGTYSKPTYAGSEGILTYTPKLGFGGGALLGFALGSRVTFEVGALYISRSYDTAGEGLFDTYNSQLPYLQIPIQFRFWLARFVNIGVGGYYAMGLGNVKYSDGSTASFADYGLKTSDYGLLGSIGFDIPLGNAVGLLIQGQYVYGLADTLATATPGFSYKFQDMQGLVGIRFGNSGMMK